MKRLDATLVELGLAPSRTKAQAMIGAGEIEILRGGEWKTADDNSLDVSKLQTSHIRVRENSQTLKFVSRGGLKLEAAFSHLKLNPSGWRCLDVGVSTGGFTDFLLKSGAAAVLGVDVGHGQLHTSLESESRLTSIEGLHVKDMPGDSRVKAWLRDGVDFCVIDVSFISLTQVFPILTTLLPKGTRVLALVKPQFEGGRVEVTAELFDDVRGRVLHAANKCGFSSMEYFSSEVKGQDGNQEFFLLCRRD